MQAIVLAAGCARRMRPLSDTCHKGLLPIGDTTILSRLVDALEEAGIDRLTVVTGYRAPDVEDHLRARSGGLHLDFVRNEAFATTNNIVSLRLGLDAIALNGPRDDVLLSECDVLLAPGLLTRLANSPSANAALVGPYHAGMDGTVVTVADGLVTRLITPSEQGPRFDYHETFKTLNVYRFSAEFCRESLAPRLRAQVDAGDDSSYYEAVLARLGDLRPHGIGATVVAPDTWAEVDDPNDLTTARFRFEPGARASILDRAMGGHWSLDVLDFAYMRNAHFPPAALVAAMRHALPALLTNYGSTQDVVNEKLALFLSCDPVRVLALNGATQAYPMLRRLWAGLKVAIPAPTFGEYPSAFPEAVRYADTPGYDEAELERLAAECDVLVVVSPNSPTGTTLSTSWLHQLASRHPRSRFLVDESFVEFSDQPPLRELLEVDPLDNVAILCSLSKTLGVPGLRIGYLYTSDASLLATIAADIPVWNMNAAAEFMLEAVVKYRPELAASLAQSRADREQLSEALRQLEGVARVHPSEGDFLLAELRGEEGTAARVRDGLLRTAAIDVKDVSAKFRGDRQLLRLAVRDQDDNRRLIDSLRSLAQGPT